MNVQAANERLLRARRVARTMVGVCRRIILGGFLIEDANGKLVRSRDDMWYATGRAAVISALCKGRTFGDFIHDPYA